MSISEWLDGLYQDAVPEGAGSGPSSGPKFVELESRWRAFIEGTEARIDDAEQHVHDAWAGIEEDGALYPAIEDDLLDLLGEEDDAMMGEGFASPVFEVSGAEVAEYSSGSLHDRLKHHLPASSAFSSLVGLISTKRSNEDIQSELVEILGFEGEGLGLVEELMRPGARDRVVHDSGLLGGKVQGRNGGTVDKDGNGGASTNAKYLPSARLVVNAHKGKNKKKAIDITEMIGSNEDIARRIHEQLDRPKAMFVEEGARVIQQEVLPHVYTSGASVSAGMSMGGRFAMPEGTTREYADTYEEVVIPPTRPVPPRISERPVKINDLPPLAKGCFPKYVTLNRMQSIVQPVAMNTNENLLICAPTGAGKTDVAIMSVLRVLQQHVREGPSTHPSGFSIDRDAFKIIYVAPMKALAAEITRKFGKRLAWLGIKVRELTGDMQLTRQEIAETQILVTTPEKWDVVTRKPTGEGELASKVKLLIIDEVHLLNEDRGAVIETIVARTLRQVESSQSLIRIVGLSATLPNYRDVSDFLRVNPYQGLFFFDASFRPVPLEQHFIGVTGKARSPQQARNLDKVVFDKVAELVQDGHQVMVFVHARKETVKTATKIKEMSMEEGMTTFFEATDHPKYQLYRREVSTSRNREMKELFDAGFGIHHAGMLRSDRNMMEKMFEDQAIKVLCCTSTLAWGVNLPAHAVIIKGTQVYDSSRGAFMDLSVLDVLQIFGRAGRPGYETSGVGYICTSHDKLDHYLYNIMSQHPIESKFIAGTIDSLNAEIALGTIANVQEAIQWLGYTYLFVRMRKEPMIYGMSHDEPKDDPQLGNKRNEIIVQAARQLSSPTVKMIRYDEIKNAFAITDLGRIAAKYYLKHQSIEIFNGLFNPKMKNADLFAMLSQATEFEQIQVRENEVEELTAILESDHCPMEVKGGVTSKQGKVNILLQAHISKVFIEDFALVSDSAYVAQNAARIIRALLEIALSRNWANNAILLIDLSKAIERRMWPYEHPLAQITTLQRDTLHSLKQWADDTEIAELREMDPKELGERMHLNERHGAAVRDAALSLPTVGVEYALRPLSHNVLQLCVKVVSQFQWNARISSSAEPFYVWIQDDSGITILQWRHVLVRPATKEINIDFLIPLGEAPPASVTVVSASDRWLGSDTVVAVPLAEMVMPDLPPESTPLLDIPYLHVAGLGRELEQAYNGRGITTLNGIQSQVFWPMYHTQNNVLLSAPVASGKSLMGEMAVWHALRCDKEALVLVIVPDVRAVFDVATRMQESFRGIKTRVGRWARAGDVGGMDKGIVVTHPLALLGAPRAKMLASITRADLFLLEDLHLLDDVYELVVAQILMLARPARTRIVGLATSLNDPTDLAEWLGVEDASRFSFLPADRGNPIGVKTKPFTILHSPTLMKVMIKPAYDVIKSASAASGGVVVFVPSRAACRPVAADLVTQSGTEMDLNGFLGAPRADVEPMLQSLRDTALFEPLLHGIGYVLPTMAPADLALVLELFASGVIRALIAPREACWTLPVRSETVLLLGAQYVKSDGPASSSTSDRQVVSYSRAELVRMQGFAAPSAGPHEGGGQMFVMCQAEQAASIPSALSDGLPLESDLPALLGREAGVRGEAVRALETMLLGAAPVPREAPPRPQINRPLVPDLRKRDVMDLLGWTYFRRRAQSNPTCYGVWKEMVGEGVSRIVDRWFVGVEWREDVRAVLPDGEKGKGKGKGGARDDDEVGQGAGAGAVVDAQVGEVGVGEKDGETADAP